LNDRTRGILLLLVGLVLIAAGVVAVFLLTQQVVTPRAAPTAVPVVKSPVVIVTHDISLGALLKAEDLSILEVPAETVPRDAMTSIDEAAGKYVKTELVQGEMVLLHNLANPTNINHDLAYTLSEDHVLMAISFSDTMTSMGIIQRGDIIDIFVTRTDMVQPTPAPGEPTPEPGKGKVPKLFTFDANQKMSVTAMVMDVVVSGEQNAEATPTPGQTKYVIHSYLLAMNPQDALVLKHLKDTGAQFDLVIRAPTSTKKFDLTPITEEYIVELYGLEILP
jgi:pilus assembly protein CpaB